MKASDPALVAQPVFASMRVRRVLFYLGAIERLWKIMSFKRACDQI
jgi:hypothetical protein